MRNFLAFVGAVVIAIVGVGIWQGWFKFGVDSNKKVSIEVDGQKATEDIKHGLDKGKEVASEFGERAKDSMKKSDSTPAAGTPVLGGK